MVVCALRLSFSGPFVWAVRLQRRRLLNVTFFDTPNKSPSCSLNINPTNRPLSLAVNFNPLPLPLSVHNRFVHWKLHIDEVHFLSDLYSPGQQSLGETLPSLSSLHLSQNRCPP